MNGKPHGHASADEFGWLLSRFAGPAAQVRHAVVVSVDGRLVAMAQGLGEDDARRLAVVTIAFGRLAGGAADAWDAEWAGRIVAEHERGYLVVAAINALCAIGIVAAPRSDLAALTADVARLAREIGSSVDSDVIDELARDLARRFPATMLPNSNTVAPV